MKISKGRRHGYKVRGGKFNEDERGKFVYTEGGGGLEHIAWGTDGADLKVTFKRLLDHMEVQGI